jgi:hypothetical protein
MIQKQWDLQNKLLNHDTLGHMLRQATGPSVGMSLCQSFRIICSFTVSSQDTLGQHVPHGHP